MLRLIAFILMYMFFLFSGEAQNFEMYKGDTINRRDANNLRQGEWVSFDQSRNVEERGNFADNKKAGIWKGFYPSGKIKHEITYAKNRPDGYARFYYENGKISEEGIWRINKWVGDYKYFHENGNLAYDWKYNETGKRTGEQKYYYSDGSLMIKGDWNDGKKRGVLTEFYQDGSIKSEMKFNEGVLDVPSIKEYQVAEKPANRQVAPKIQTPTSSENSNEKVDVFNRTGYYKTFNEFKKVDREGDFVNGKLIKGKRYLYDDDGNITRVLIYEDGKVTKTLEKDEL